MKRKLAGAFSIAVLLCVAAYLVSAATVNVVEIPSAGANPGNTIAASHSSGKDLTDVKVLGQIDGTTDGVMVSDTANARDGNEVTGVYSAPSSDTRWEVKLTWTVRGQVKTASYVTPQPPPAAPTMYFMGIDFEAQTIDLQSNLPALTASDPKQLELWNENTFVSAVNSTVDVQDHVDDAGTIKFRYLLDIYAAGQINRGEMAIWVRGERWPRNDDDTPVASTSWMKLHNTATGQVIVDTDEYPLN